MATVHFLSVLLHATTHFSPSEFFVVCMVAWSFPAHQQPDKVTLHSLAFFLKRCHLIGSLRAVANVQFVLYAVKGQCGKRVYVCVPACD